MRTLTIVAKATFTGFLILIVLTTTIALLEPILRDIFPPKPVVGLGITFDANLRNRMNILFFLIILSNCVVGFITGFLVRAWGEKVGPQIWHSLISGFVVGTCGSLLLFYVLVSMYPRFILDLAVDFTLGFVSALLALLGYHIANFRYRKRVLE